jgi:predicted dehydrogenase/threonine dehydrogenase-like Zn-dependent dehydrogenase
MKQVVLQGGKASLIEAPVPAVPSGGVLVRVVTSVISAGTERANLHSTGESLVDKARRKPELVQQVLKSVEKDGLRVTADRVLNRLQEPIATGYSCAGIIEAVGERVKDLRPGQLVSCAGAKYANHAQFIAVPRNLCHPVPAGVTAQDAASATIGAIALQGVRQADIELGHTLAVVGLGLIGLLEVQLAHAAGATVIAVDPQASRQALALELGAARACAPEDLPALADDLTGGLGLDATLIAAATKSEEPLRDAMQVTRKRGKVVIVGDVGLSLTRSPFYEKEIELRIACSTGPGRYDPAYEEGGQDYPAAFVRWTGNRNMGTYLELLKAGRVRWQPLVTHRLPLEEAGQAFALLQGDASVLAVELAYPEAAEQAATVAVSPRGRARAPREGAIRLGVIGAGAFARAVHFPVLRQLGKQFSVVGVSTRSGLSATVAAKEIGAGSATADYRTLLERSDVDAVLIATRHDQHARLAQEALRAGKAVLLEKPAAMNQEELDALLATVEETGQPFLIGFNRRFSRAATLLRERMAAHDEPGMIVYRVNASRGDSTDWSVGEEGGGRAVGEACHMVDFLHAVAGAEAKLEDIQVLARPGADSDANFEAMFRFSTGLVGNLVYTTLGHPGLAKERIEAFLGQEVVVVDDFRAVQVHRSGLSPRPSTTKIDKGFADEWRAFHRACTGAGPLLPIPLHQLRSVAEATFQIRDAARR